MHLGGIRLPRYERRAPRLVQANIGPSVSLGQIPLGKRIRGISLSSPCTHRDRAYAAWPQRARVGQGFLIVIERLPRDLCAVRTDISSSAFSAEDSVVTIAALVPNRGMLPIDGAELHFYLTTSAWDLSCHSAGSSARQSTACLLN